MQQNRPQHNRGASQNRRPFRGRHGSMSGTPQQQAPGLAHRRRINASVQDQPEDLNQLLRNLRLGATSQNVNAANNAYRPPLARNVHVSSSQQDLLRSDIYRAPYRRGNREASTSSEQSYRNRNPQTSNSGFERRNFNDRRQGRQNNGNDEHSHSSRRAHYGVGFRALEQLLNKDSEQLMLELLNSKRGFLEFLQKELSGDAIIVFTRVLAKVSNAEFAETKYKVLQTYLEGTFSEKLVNYILCLHVQENSEIRKNRYFWDDTDGFWRNVVIICQDILKTLPTFAVRVLPRIVKSLAGAIPNFEQFYDCHVSDEITNNVKMLTNCVQDLVKEQEEKEKALAQKKLRQEDNEEEPPDDFRQIDVYPSSLELIGDIGFLRRNVVKGPYKNVDHYLDVQFRLLREDFVGPLRTAVHTFRSAQSGKRAENVKIHKKVRFLTPETVNENYCIRLRFDFSTKKTKFSFENSKRFLFGSLLCFTRDNFKTFIFGKVAERKVEDLGKGELIVGFDRSVFVLYNEDYVMVECNVYFEPYFHVLNVLKNMNTENFPMKKYIIEVDSSMAPPQYLTQPNLQYQIQLRTFSPLMNWPAKIFYNFNPSQAEAFRAALTQEFVIIQGPPGTGKTYLGLKIAKTLIENAKTWYNNSPMLVICYTNHALDQFLEGLTQFTTKIMRVGGQSKNENLKAYNLRNRSKFKWNAATMQQRHEVERILTKIKSITENLKQVNFYHSVRKFDVFEDIVPNYYNSWFHRVKPNDILDWLLGDRDTSAAATACPQNFGPAQPKVVEVAENQSNNSSDDDDDDDIDDNFDNQDDDLLEMFDAMNVQCSVPLVTLTSVQSQIEQLEVILDQLVLIAEPTFQNLMDTEKFSLQLAKSKDTYVYLRMRLDEGKQRAAPTEMPQNTDLQNPNNMNSNDRWSLYFYWLNIYKTKMQEKLDLLNKEFREAYKVYEQLRDIEDTNSMKGVLVVGMTTTGAARLRSCLRTLKNPIVIVEEAAEVLEAHIITSLTEHCQHLILIGDHQQLKPSTANYKIERFYNLGISLFERMVLNKIQLYSLEVQHRMRPEISKLITPTIYPNLRDHETVLQRPTILGMEKFLFFLNHKHPEVDSEGTSKKNYHEAKFLISLARHLVLNGYMPENITILAAYLGQMFEMQKERRKHKDTLDAVRIAVLDNYQGEESDIILLSLVRSNPDNKIGFLSIENRVCVALSRARNGFYIMGNMDQLCSQSQLWCKIKATLDDQDAIGEELPLRCQVHRDTVTYVKTDTDFMPIVEGGCSKICDAELACGHKCTSLCHILDQDHQKYKCRKQCGRPLCDSNPEHICLKSCFEDCGPCNYKVPRKLPCGHNIALECHIDPDRHRCMELVPTVLPCGHETDKPCSLDPEKYLCPHPCEKRVEPCGHSCSRNCHIRYDPDHLEYKCRQPCARYRKGCTVRTQKHICKKYCYEDCDNCTILVRKHRTVCPHVFDVPCIVDVDTLSCEKPCTKILHCGHKCKNKCNEPCGTCEIKVEKVIPKCGHKVKVQCSAEPDRNLCNKKCPLQLPCGHPCTAKCNEPCTSKCKVLVDCNKIGLCGHTITKIICYKATADQGDLKSLLKFCNNPCGAKLKCGHKCCGTCGECFQGRIHKRCAEKCGVPLVCDHLCKFPCREACRPCNEKCPLRCPHNRCGKKCGDVCTPCKEQCRRRCLHQQCSKPCGDICDVPPCEEPCPRRLKCGHLCIGFCGDPCPPMCMDEECDKEELTNIEFGFEAEDARYVFLNDCGHVIENTALEMWLEQNQGDVSFKVCPRCKACIKTTTRFSDYTKRAMMDVAKAKVQLHGSHAENEEKRAELNIELAALKIGSARLRILCVDFSNILTMIERRLMPTRKNQRQPINKHELNALKSKLKILTYISKMCCKQGVELKDSNEIYLPQVSLIIKVLLRDENYITDQENEDIDFELNRLNRIIEFSQIKQAVRFTSHVVLNVKVRNAAEIIKQLLYSFSKFSNENEKIIIEKLKELNAMVASGIGISESEKREIVKAMGFQKGHWYKCPNGHIYAIGECGGAVHESKCPECGAKIGGTGHRLLNTNAVATEMDGATHGAWSEFANLGNFDPNDLRF